MSFNAFSPAQHLANAQPILSVLKDGPRHILWIVKALGWSRMTTNRRLLALERHGEVKRVGNGSYTQWALPGYQPIPRDQRIVINHVTPLAFGKKTRQAAQEPAEPTESASGRPTFPAPAWWACESREGFPGALEARQRALRDSIASRWVPLRMLQ